MFYNDFNLTFRNYDRFARVIGLQDIPLCLVDGDVLQVEVDAGVGCLYPDVLAAPLGAGEVVLVPPELVPADHARLSFPRTLQCLC